MRVNNLKELETELRKRIQNALTNEVNDVVKDVMQDHIISDVYDKYDPVMYARKMNNGGLLDRNNIVSDFKGALRLSVKNITLGDKYYGLHTYNKSGGYTSTPMISKNYNKPITEVIETGQGYDVEGWEYDGVPRPFMRNSCEDLRDNHYHTIAMKNGLKRQGLEVK